VGNPGCDGGSHRRQFCHPNSYYWWILAALGTLFVIEWIRRKDWHKALASLKGMAVGWGWAFVIRFIIGLIMIGFGSFGPGYNLHFS